MAVAFMLDALSIDTFSPLVGQLFEVGEPGRAQALELVSATAASRASVTARTGFSLIFRGTAQSLLPQGTYPVAHAAIGSLPVFIVPVGLDAQGMQYEAIFN